MKFPLAAIALTLCLAAAPSSARTPELPANVPQRVDEFLAYCRTNAADCDRYLIAADAALRRDRLGDRSNYCGPGKITHAVRNRILNWLARTYPDTLEGPTESGVREALRILYQCSRP